MIVFDGFKILGFVFTAVFLALFGLLFLAVVIMDKYSEWRNRK
jgi:hypothetical protein